MAAASISTFEAANLRKKFADQHHLRFGASNQK